MANDLSESSVLPLWNLLFEYEREDNDIFIYLLGDNICEYIDIHQYILLMKPEWSFVFKSFI